LTDQANRKTIDGLCKGRYFEREIIVLCVRWYLRYKLSSRDLVEMIAEGSLTMQRSLTTRGDRVGEMADLAWQGFRGSGGTEKRS
jgi:hypothetical protein